MRREEQHPVFGREGRHIRWGRSARRHDKKEKNGYPAENGFTGTKN
jgi:hypothetical protein